MKDFKKMMGKEDDGKEGMKKDAKLNVLKHLRKMASDMMGEDVKGGMMSKVTEAPKNTDELAQGKDTRNWEAEPEEEPEHDMDIGPEGESDEDCSAEELDAKIAKLQELKAKKKMQEY